MMWCRDPVNPVVISLIKPPGRPGRERHSWAFQFALLKQDNLPSPPECFPLFCTMSTENISLVKGVANMGMVCTQVAEKRINHIWVIPSTHPTATESLLWLLYMCGTCL